MEFKVKQSWLEYWYIWLGFYPSHWLLPEGTITTNDKIAEKENWKTKTEAQQFLDNWMPKKEWLTTDEVRAAAELGELEALDCSIEHWKQNVLNVRMGTSLTGHDHCAICVRDEILRPDDYGPQCTECILNNYLPKKGTTEACCDEYNKFRQNPTETNAIVMLNKLVEIRNRYVVNYEETKMIKELTVAEISEALGYEVKVVKEQPKPEPYQFKVGDVAVTLTGNYRFIVKINSKLYAVDKYGNELGGYEMEKGQEHFETYNYKKIGRLKAFLVE